MTIKDVPVIILVVLLWPLIRMAINLMTEKENWGPKARTK